MRLLYSSPCYIYALIVGLLEHILLWFSEARGCGEQFWNFLQDFITFYNLAFRIFKNVLRIVEILEILWNSFLYIFSWSSQSSIKLHKIPYHEKYACVSFFVFFVNFLLVRIKLILQIIRKIWKVMNIWGFSHMVNFSLNTVVLFYIPSMIKKTSML